MVFPFSLYYCKMDKDNPNSSIPLSQEPLPAKVFHRTQSLRKKSVREILKEIFSLPISLVRVRNMLTKSKRPKSGYPL